MDELDILIQRLYEDGNKSIYEYLYLIDNIQFSYYNVVLLKKNLYLIEYGLKQ